MVLRLEEAQPPAALGQVVDVVGHVVREVVDLVDERWDEKPADQRDCGQRRDRDHASCRTPTAELPLQLVDGRIERQRQEERDKDPREDVPRDPEDLQRDEGGDEQADDEQDRARSKVDEALLLGRHGLQHRCRIGR